LAARPLAGAAKKHFLTAVVVALPCHPPTACPLDLSIRTPRKPLPCAHGQGATPCAVAQSLPERHRTVEALPRAAERGPPRRGFVGRIQPSNALAYIERGEALYWEDPTEYFAELIEDFNYAVRIDPDNAGWYSLRAKIWLNEHEYDMEKHENAKAIED
jgi:hypothetical protein